MLRIAMGSGFALVMAAIVLPSRVVDGHKQQEAKDQPATAVIAGRAVDAMNAGSLANATVMLFAPGNPSWPRMGRRVETDEAGRFEFSGLTAGRYSLALRANGYVSGEYGALTVGDYLGNRIDLGPGEKLSNFVVPLSPAARLSGTVTDEGGEPAVGVTVHFLKRQYFGMRPLWMPSGRAMTDDRGRFASTGAFSPGEYLALVRSEPSSLPEPALIPEGGFYGGGGRSVSSASVITLRPGEHREGIDFVTRFTPRPAALSISGRITAPEGVLPAATVVENANLRIGSIGLVRRDAEDLIADLEGFRTWVRRDGLFSFSHVPPGEYRLRFVYLRGGAAGAATGSLGTRALGKPQPVSQMTMWFVDLPLTLTRSVTELEVPLQPAGRVRGSVVFDGRSTLPSAEVLASVLMHLDHAEGRELRPGVVEQIPTGAVDAQGRFETIGLPPGRYVIEPTAVIDNVQHVVTSVRVAGRELLQSGLDVGPSGVSDVVVTLSGRTWSLSGVVRDQSGRPVPNGRIILFPRVEADRDAGGYLSRPRVVQIAANRFGAFQAAGAFGGEYLVAAVASPPEFWMAQEYLQSLVPLATALRLELGGKHAIDVRMK